MIEEEDAAFVSQWLNRQFGSVTLRAPVKEPPYDPEDGGIPLAMLVGPVSEDGWGVWKPLPSTLTEEDVAALERKLPAPFPPLFRAYLGSHLVLDYALHGDGFHIQMPGLPSDNPLGAIQELIDKGAPVVQAGYLPFAEYQDGWGLVCFDSRQPDADGDCAVVWFDHEDVLNLAGEPGRAELAPLARPLFGSFREFLTALQLERG